MSISLTKRCRYTIEVGDEVVIYLLTSNSAGGIASIFGEVLYVPQSVGDSWVVQEINFTGANSTTRVVGSVYYVQNYSFIRLSEKRK